MKIYLIRTEPVQELAAEPGTLALLKTALRPYAAPGGTGEGQLHRPSSLGVPLVADSAVPPGVAHFRPVGRSGSIDVVDPVAAVRADEAMRAELRAALKSAGITQTSAASQLRISQKHLNRMLTGRAALPQFWADRIRWLCNRPLVIGSGPGAPEQQLEQS